MSYLPCDDETPEEVGVIWCFILLEVEEHRDAEDVNENLKQVGLVIENGRTVEDDQELDDTDHPEEQSDEREPIILALVVFSFHNILVLVSDAANAIEDEDVSGLVDDGD